MIRVKFLIALALGAFLIGLPWIAYGVGLANVEGRPAPPLTPHLDAEQMEFLHVAIRKAGVFSVEPMSPWDYAMNLMRSPENLATGGMKATEIVAADWTAAHQRRPEPLLRRLSEIAMTIWLTQNWKTDEILLRAYQIEQLRSLHRPKQK
jgi:hypothetical protein